jgi:4a-hydroxytetrahydrobiopterin dehydratase
MQLQKWINTAAIVLSISVFGGKPEPIWAKELPSNRLASMQHHDLALSLRRLSEVEIVQRLRDLPGWQVKGKQLTCQMQFENFVAAIDFVNQLVKPSEAVAHHPDLTISYNQVNLSLTTHDAGGLTALDFALAKTISQLSSFPGCQVKLR